MIVRWRRSGLEIGRGVAKRLNGWARSSARCSGLGNNESGFSVSNGLMILGESGVGKEVLGRGMHQLSRRAKGPFVAINLAAIPETMVESEVFGYEKGAFTGADGRHLMNTLEWAVVRADPVE
ncbi:MAG: sigma 54-interacting transcriptional regulator [Acidobacteria bacterium]|nr:sigma 54-interacting transcriptional regulator [Acidobacteriota bacterium]